MFWRKKVVPALQVAEPRELTGIEKAEKEEEANRIAEWKRESLAKREKVLARIAELREQIKPQTDEIRALEMGSEPDQYFNYSQHYANYFNCAHPPYAPIGSSGLSSLLGFTGQMGRY